MLGDACEVSFAGRMGNIDEADHDSILLDDPRDEHTLLPKSEGLLKSATLSRSRVLLYGALAQVVLILLYSSMFWVILHHSNMVTGTSTNQELLPLPARNAIQLETRRFSTSPLNNPFIGEARPELDEAWHYFLRNDNIQIPEAELRRLNLRSIPVKDSDNVIASLGSFHALHCLVRSMIQEQRLHSLTSRKKKTRQLVYRDAYHEGKDVKSMNREFRHVDHCIEYLREYVMCHPDLSFVTFHWINETSKFPPEVRMPTTWDVGLHECANWESLNEWAGQRYFNLYDVDQLLKPEHGLDFD